MKSYVCIVLSFILFSCVSTGQMKINETLPARKAPNGQKGYTLEEARYCMYEAFKHNYYRKELDKHYCKDEISSISSYYRICNFDLISKENRKIISKEIRANKSKILEEVKPLRNSCSNKKMREYGIIALVWSPIVVGLVIDPLLTVKIVGGVYLGGLVLMGIMIGYQNSH